jgi:hypothetical protein
VYREVCAGIRTTDEISLKLLAAVPLVTGVGITLVVREPSAGVGGNTRALLSLFAAIVTFAIYRWERKNIATCRHFRTWAAILERDHFKVQSRSEEKSVAGDLPHGRVTTPRILGQSWGKTQAAALLYWTAILGWVLAGAYALAAQ